MSVVPPALGAIDAIAEDEGSEEENDEGDAAAAAAASSPATLAQLQDRAAAHVSAAFVPPSPEVAAQAAAAAVEEEEDEFMDDGSFIVDDEDDDAESTSSGLSRVTEAVMDAYLSPLAALLRACGQSADDVRSMGAALKPWLGAGGVLKIGEGTYGEAFKCASAGVVIKVVPVGGDFLFNGAVPKACDAMRAEANISLLINRLREGLDAGRQPAAARLKVKEVRARTV